MAGFLKFSSIALKNLFSKPATRNYPDLPPKSTAATRGAVQIDIEQCVLCGLCMRRCPSEAIKVDRTNKSWSIERMGCVQCADCVSICPKKCLSMIPKYTAPSSSKTVDTYRKEAPAATPSEMVATNKSNDALLVNMENCVLCGLCVKQCPVGAIKVDRTTKTWSIERAECLLCGACAQRCPKKCLSVGAVSGEVPAVYLKDSAPTASTSQPSGTQASIEEKHDDLHSALLMDIENCVLCGLCVKQCPVNAIKVDRDAKTWSVDRDACLGCGACAARCPKKCLRVEEITGEAPAVYTKEVKPAVAAPIVKPQASEAMSASTETQGEKQSALSVNMESCVLCGLCAKQCPVEAIKVDRAAKRWSIDRTACLLCAACAERCPKKSIALEEATEEVMQTSVYTKAAPSPALTETPASEVSSAPSQEGTKSALHIGIENCVLCGMCVKQCPVEAIKVDRTAKTWSIDRTKCVLCGACAGRCPKKCLGIGKASEATMQVSVYAKA